MARGRHPAALFDVLSRPQSYEKLAPSGFSALSNFLKSKLHGRRSVAANALTGAASPSSGGTVVPTLTPSPNAGPHFQAPMPEPSVATTPLSPGLGASGQVVAPLPPARRRASASGERVEGVSLSFDAARHEITLRMSYISGMIVGVGLVVLVTMAFLVGRQANSGRSTLLAVRNTGEPRLGSVSPNVGDLATAPRYNPPAETDSPGGGTMTTTPPAFSAVQAPTQPISIESNERQIGLNYVVMQSYPEGERKMADDAAAALRQAGIGCTLERLKDFNGSSKWCSVVGTRGFSAVFQRTAEYQAYLAKIKQTNEQNVRGGRRTFKALDPMPMRWNGTMAN